MKIKKKIAVLVSLLLVSIMPISVMASPLPAEDENIKIEILEERALTPEEIENIKNAPNKGVSGAGDGSISTYGIGVPTKKWDINSGSYSFYGNAESTNLYTNYYFNGSTIYTVVIDNAGDSTFSAKVKTFFSTKRTLEVSPGTRKVAAISGFGTNDNVYILFYAPCHFSGYIKKG